MRRTVILLAGFAILLTVGATAQENGSEISLQGTGFFTKDTNGQGISRTTTDTGGFQVGYRFNFSRWLAAEVDYGYDRNTEKYFGGSCFGSAPSPANTSAANARSVSPSAMARGFLMTMLMRLLRSAALRPETRPAAVR